MAIGEVVEQGAEQQSADRRDHAEAHGAFAEATVRAHVLLCASNAVEDEPGVPVQGGTGGCRNDAAATPFEERLTHLGLEPLDRLRHGRLHQVQVFTGPRHTAGLDDRRESSQVA